MGNVIQVPIERWLSSKAASKRRAEVAKARGMIERIRLQYNYGRISAEEADQMYKIVIDKFKLTSTEA